MFHKYFDRVAPRRFSPSASHRNAPKRPGSLALLVLDVEILEQRQLLTAVGQAVPLYEELSTITAKGTVVPLATSGPTGYTPAEIRHAYGFDQLSFNSGAVAANGSGETIAIVDAYDDPNIASDLHQFDATLGLSDPTLTKVNQSGGTSLPRGNTGWATEIALDVEWAHAIAPGANILLVEANDSSYTNLLTAVNYVRNAAGVVAVSMSWGGSEFSGETGYDGYFTTPTGHAGVTFFVASGDSVVPAEYPAASPNVVSVGGTTLNLTSHATISSETVWTGSTGGVSSFESEPNYQKGVVTQTTTHRATPDVAYDSNPNTGFPVYDSYGTSAPWGQYGGTSDAAPQWAALTAIADQGRALAGLSSLTSTQLLTDLYQMPGSGFHDITSGASSGSPSISASAGYDLVTGRGSPAANLIVGSLVGSTPAAPTATHFSVTAPSSLTAGGTFSITVSALSSSNANVAGYTGTVHFSSSDVAAGLPADYAFTAADAGVHTFTGLTLKTAGNETIAATDKTTSAVTGSTTIAVNPATATHLAFVQQPTSVTAGSSITPAVTVRVYDAYNNLVSVDNTDRVTLSLGANSSPGSLSGTTTVTVTGGTATFGNLSINQAGSYTLVAGSGSLAGATSSSFSVTTVPVSGSTVIESFDSGLGSYQEVGASVPSASTSTTAAHDGTSGLLDTNGNDWIYRNDAASQVTPGDTISVWLQFSGTANGRAYFGFGASATGTLSLVAAPNTNQLILQNNTGYSYTDIADASQTWLANHWYRLEVDWGTSGAIVGKLFDSNGTTLLQSVSGTSTAITSGGIAFRGFGANKFWDTVTVITGVNSFSQSTGATGHSSAPNTPSVPVLGTTPASPHGSLPAQSTSPPLLKGAGSSSAVAAISRQLGLAAWEASQPSGSLSEELLLEESILETLAQGILGASKA